MQCSKIVFFVHHIDVRFKILCFPYSIFMGKCEIEKWRDSISTSVLLIVPFFTKV